MHKLLIVIGFCLVTFLGVISCYDERNTFGDRLVDSDLRNISMDTSTIVMIAVLIDSLETSGKQVVLAGDRKSTRLNSSHMPKSRMPSSA